jgi:hypothetical protein
MYESVAETSGRPIVVDSSKKPGRALAIAGMPELEVSIIHLVRNGLNFLDSSIHRGKLSPDDPLFLYKVFRLGTKWFASNFAAERAVRMNRHGGVQLRYEDLLRDPQTALRKVEEGLGLDLQPIRDHVREGAVIPWRHMESGSRHRQAGPTTLKPEFARNVQLPAPVRLAFQLGGGLLSLRYGYR